MRGRTLKDLQRRPPKLKAFYCSNCGMLLPENKTLCSGCEEAKQLVEVMSKAIKEQIE